MPHRTAVDRPFNSGRLDLFCRFFRNFHKAILYAFMCRDLTQPINLTINFVLSFLSVFWTAFWVIIAILYFAYFAYCMVKTFDVNDEGAVRLLVVTILASVFIVARLVINCCLGEKEIHCGILDDKGDTRVERIKTA